MDFLKRRVGFALLVSLLIFIPLVEAQEATEEPTEEPTPAATGDGTTTIINIEQPPPEEPAPEPSDTTRVINGIIFLFFGGLLAAGMAGLGYGVSSREQTKFAKDQAEANFRALSPEWQDTIKSIVETGQRTIDGAERVFEAAQRVLDMAREITDGLPNTLPPEQSPPSSIEHPSGTGTTNTTPPAP